MLCVQHDQLAQAEEELARGTELARRGDAKFEQVYGLIAYAKLKAAQGDKHGCNELLNGAQEVLQACVDPGILPQLVVDAERELHLKARPTSHLPYAVELSERELAVLRLLRTDLTQREIGDQLYVSFNTVKSHIQSIFRKLDLSTRKTPLRVLVILACSD